MTPHVHTFVHRLWKGRMVQVRGTVSEKELHNQVVDFATQCGWKFVHFHDSRRQVSDKQGNRYLIGDKDARGWPDLYLCHPTRGVVHAELKGSTTPVEPHQIAMLDRLAETALSMAPQSVPTRRMRVHLWRPDDLPGVIVPVLARGHGPVLYGWGGHGR